MLVYVHFKKKVNVRIAKLQISGILCFMNGFLRNVWNSFLHGCIFFSNLLYSIYKEKQLIIFQNNSIPTLGYLSTLLLNFGLVFDIFWNFISSTFKNRQNYRIRGIYKSNNIVVYIVVYNLQRLAVNYLLHKKQSTPTPTISPGISVLSVIFLHPIISFKHLYFLPIA